MRRVITVLAAAPLVLLPLTGPAWAGVPIPMDGKIDRQQGFYVVSAESDGASGGTGGGGSASSGSTTTSAGSATSSSGGGSGAGSNARPVVLTAEQKAQALGAGAACSGVTATTGNVPAQCRPPAPAPSSGGGGGGGRPAPRVTVAQVREKAADQIKLTKPDLKASPCLEVPGQCTGTVGVPVWLWVGDGSTLPTDSASASAGPYTVNVEAKVREVKWSLGDGQSTICQGSGTAYDKYVHGWSAPDCGFERGWTQAGTYTLTASYVWDVNWSGSVEGSDSQTLSATQQVIVREIQTTVQSS